MTVVLTQDEFGFIADFIKQRSGIALTPDKGYLLDTRLSPIAKAHGMSDIHELVARLRASPNPSIVHQVIESMTTNESMFFRDTKPFEHLAKVILPALKAQNTSRVRIWSAACSTGQEAYSIAMTLKEESAKYPGMTYEIIGTDLADKVVERARAGIFSQFEIQRGLPIALLMKYFTQRANNNWEINDALKSMVKFSTGNLLTPYLAMGRFDVIFCRNVLIYFDEKTKADVMDRMAAILNPPGFLFLGGSESTHGLSDRYKVNDQNRGLFSLA
jgi:chemotaxis protein methyltransferase CheR